ncbi:hypothetical protein CMK14_23475 [Candidatus Poribacteria bacterium]|nr:hypothetical protein [Candidatus Poribacteria bacterium]
MQTAWKAFYNTVAVPTLYTGFQALAFFNPKVRQGLLGRQSVFESLTEQLVTARSFDRTAWFHFTSVGEFEQAKPLIDHLYPQARIILTYFSPSVAANARRYPLADAAIYLPLDSRQNAQRLFDLIQPSTLIFSKFDIWPNLVWEAKRRQIPVALIAGTLQPHSKRLQPVASAFFRSVHQEIDLHCVISEQDAVRFSQLCPPTARIEVTGDTRFDRVYNRALVVPDDEAFLPGQSTLSAPVVVAGSTYTEEEEILIESLSQMTTVAPHLIIVPHEPTPVHVQQLTERLRKSRLTYVKYSELVEESNLSQVRVIIIDTIGILAKLYRMADVTFVGGSFHGSVHNVMEPAAMEKPILFGPTIDNSHEAHLLVQCGGAEIVDSANQLADVLSRWLILPQQCQQVGRSAQQVIQDNLGATERTLDHLQPYFSI